MLVAIKSCPFSLVTSGLWHYGLWSFQVRGTKLGRFLPKNQHAQSKSSKKKKRGEGQVTKNGHHCTMENDLKIDKEKKCQ